ncbi:hypothetical protein WOLCODRAFT_138198 [Wolfiporia cocos MD-104 SS10]|uniref:DUF7598 domain-containing protein n=1 Tax=Wolfiporia cocos (strain MD-104) TaxID=742152 RepID=A0A2H3JNN3_WOLCO|nr:hypothetical protein WOLCODRAFT_138198 [Wolfiporia cocos MD-104 SS10]
MAPARAYIFIGLNVTRALSIIALLLLFASSIVTLVQDIKAVNVFIADGKTDEVTTGNSTTACTELDYVPNSTVPNQPAGAFWAVLNRLLIMAQSIILILSELGWPAAFFNRYFPVLGDEFGLGALGAIQCLLGAAVLSHHVNEFSLVSAFLLFSIGCLNMVLGLIFRESAKKRRAITSWRETDDVLPRTSLRSGPRPFLTATHTGSSATAWDEKSGSSRSGKGFGRQGEKAALQRGATVTMPPEALPSYAPRPTASPAPTYLSRTVRYKTDEASSSQSKETARPESVLSYTDGNETPNAV